MRTTYLRRLAFAALLILGASRSGVAQVLSTPGTITTNGQSVTQSLIGVGSASITISGTWTGTLSFRVAPDGGTCDDTISLTGSGGASGGSSTTSNGTWLIQNAGFTQVCVTATAPITGTATVTFTRGFGVSATVDLSGSSLDATISAPANNPLHVRPSDGSNAQSFGTADADSGAGTVTEIGMLLLVPGSGGHVAITGDAANGLDVDVTRVSGNVTVVNGGTFATQAAQSGNWSVRTQDGAGNTIGSTSNALDVNIKSGAATGLAQGSTTSGQLGSLTMGAVTTSAPSYTTAQTSPISLDTSGNLRITGTVAATQSGNWTARLADGSGNALSSILAGSLRGLSVTVIDSGGNQVSSFGGSGGTASAFGSTFPSGASSGTAVGGYDGTNMQGFRVVDADTSGGTFYAMATNAVFRASGTPVEAGTSSNPWNVVFPSAQSVNATLGAETTKIIGTVNVAASQTIAVTQATASSLNAQVVGAAASGASKAGNPVQVGGVFNTTQPTVTNGQAVEAQYTARGAAIVGTGTDVFHVTVDSVPSTTVTATNLSTNIAQMNGVTVTMGNGVSGTGVQRVTIASDSTGQVALAAGSATIGSLAANQSVNVAQINGVTPLMGNGASGTGAARVTIANDSTGILASIGSITSSIVPGTGATNLGKAIDSAVGATDTGVGALVKRVDTPATLTPANGDWVPQQVDSTGRTWTNPFPSSPSASVYLPVRISIDGSSFLTADTQLTHDGALTPGSTTGSALFFRASATAPTNVATDDAVLPWALQNGSLVANLASGGTLITSTGSSLNVNVTGGSTGNGASSATGSAVPAQADYQGLNVSGTLRGQTGVNPTGTVYSAQTDLTSIGGVSFTAHDGAAASQVPLLVGGYASQAAPSDVTADNDAVRAWYLRNGSQVINLAAGGTLITATSSKLDVASDLRTIGGTSVSANNGTAGNGTIRVTLASDSTGTVAPGATANQVGGSDCVVLSAASTNATNCKASSGNIYGFELYNTTTTVYYFRLYNSSGTPTCSSATGFIRSVPIPPADSAGHVNGVVLDYGNAPIGYSTGIGYCITASSTSTANDNAAAGIFGTLRIK
jgi:hypothetical protein